MAGFDLDSLPLPRFEDPVNRFATLTCLSFGAWAILHALNKRNSRGLARPPGPKGLPYLGNLFQLSSGKPWVKYKEWAKEYGSDMIYVEVMGSPSLVLNSLDDINELLEKRASNYSDRVHTPSLDMLDIGWDISSTDYGPQWRANRRIFHQYFNHNEIYKYHPVLEYQTSIFLRRLASHPKNFTELTKHLLGSIIMQISYGVSDPNYTERLVNEAEALVRGVVEVFLPGTLLVDVFPFLQYIPSWFPGAGWKRTLLSLAAGSRDVYHRMFDDALKRYRGGVQSELANVADDVIGKLPAEDDPEYAVKAELARSVTLNAYISGVDTTFSSAQALFLALAKYPHVQRRAQEELESVLGACCLPKPSDLPKLPYLTALVKELYRWHVVAPLAMPHVAKEDDEYKGYFIPKGTTVFGNAWAILHDPNIFPDPEEFKPERYLREDGQVDATVLDAEAAGFGFGRRLCPGRFLSNEMLSYIAACLLSVFDIRPPKDADGKDVELKLDTGNEISTQPNPFECEILPRSKEHAALFAEY